MQRFDLKLADGKTESWPGEDGEDAARRYVDCKGGAVIATRPCRGPLVTALGHPDQIVHAGDR